MSMSKKDHQALAGAIYAERRYRGNALTPDDVVRVVSKVLESDNPRFNRARFLAACETGDVTAESCPNAKPAPCAWVTCRRHKAVR
jgi:hypothetical protein